VKFQTLTDNVVAASFSIILITAGVAVVIKLWMWVLG
jgi:hypothetical protein